MAGSHQSPRRRCVGAERSVRRRFGEDNVTPLNASSKVTATTDAVMATRTSRLEFGSADGVRPGGCRSISSCSEQDQHAHRSRQRQRDRNETNTTGVGQ